ncbi:MAG: hypothetical protein PHE67_11585 [Campylobacterales bacterium]|nr:hypothetical protein [Campylobacterales bacterium]
MCEIYILIAFALGLFSGWLANFLLSGKYIDKALDSYYSEEQKQEMKASVHAEHRRFKLSTALWIMGLFAFFMAIIYFLSNVRAPVNKAAIEGAQAIEKADNNAVFNTLIDSMRNFSR